MPSFRKTGWNWRDASWNKGKLLRNHFVACCICSYTSTNSLLEFIIMYRSRSIETQSRVENIEVCNIEIEIQHLTPRITKSQFQILIAHWPIWIKFLKGNVSFPPISYWSLQSCAVSDLYRRSHMYKTWKYAILRSKPNISPRVLPNPGSKF